VKDTNVLTGPNTAEGDVRALNKSWDDVISPEKVDTMPVAPRTPDALLELGLVGVDDKIVVRAALELITLTVIDPVGPLMEPTLAPLPDA
jgi:hypothetical protein